MDGKKARISRNQNVDQNSQHPYTNTEHAAAQENNRDNEPVPTYIRQKTYEEESFNNRKRNKTGKHIFIAAISAVVLGVGLGIFMLNMFTNIDTNAVSGNKDPLTETADTSENAIPQDLSTYTLESFQAFVLQAGIFSKETNITVVQDKFKEAGFPTMIWERDNQYYLFANIAETEAQADSIKAMFKELKLETYEKKWTTSKVDMKLTEAEYKWLQGFHQLWNTSLKNISENQAFSSSKWSKWIESYPDNGGNTGQFFDNVKSLQKNIEKASESTGPVILLKLWKQYENFVMK